MAKIFGNAFSATDPSNLAPGTSHDAGIRRHRNYVSLASEGGGTSNTLIVGRVREGNCIHGAQMASDQNLSGINFTLGTDSNPAKYAAASAGPAAGATVRIPIVPAQLAMDPLAAPEEIGLYPSGALPAAGLVVASVDTSKR